MCKPLIMWWKRTMRWAGVSFHFGLLTWHTSFHQLSNVRSHPWPQNLSVTSCIHVLVPGCDRLCMKKNNVPHKVSGTKVRTRLVLVSHTTSKSLFATGIPENFKDEELSWRSCCNCWPFFCPSTKCWYSTHGPSRRTLMPRDMASAGTLTSLLITRISKLNCNR